MMKRSFRVSVVFVAVVVLLLAATTGARAMPWERASSVDSLPTLAAWGRDVRSALRREALSRQQGDNPAEVLGLIELYLRLAQDPRSDESPTLRQLGLRVRSRLVYVRRHIVKTISNRPNALEKRRDILAQQLVVPPGAGPQNLGGANLGGVPAAGPAQFGDELVALIERVISPATWDVVGGPSSLFYFAPLQTLVVHAPEAVHLQINDLLLQLRAARGP